LESFRPWRGGQKLDPIEALRGRTVKKKKNTGSRIRRKPGKKTGVAHLADPKKKLRPAPLTVFGVVLGRKWSSCCWAALISGFDQKIPGKNQTVW